MTCDHTCEYRRSPPRCPYRNTIVATKIAAAAGHDTTAPMIAANPTSCTYRATSASSPAADDPGLRNSASNSRVASVRASRVAWSSIGAMLVERSATRSARSRRAPSMRRCMRTPSAVCSGASTCRARNRTAASTNVRTRSLHAADPVPPSTAAGTCPTTTLVASTNATGRSPSTTSSTSRPDDQPAARASGAAGRCPGAARPRERYQDRSISDLLRRRRSTETDHQPGDEHARADQDPRASTGRTRATCRRSSHRCRRPRRTTPTPPSTSATSSS